MNTNLARLSIALLLAAAGSASAQCGEPNTSFRANDPAAMDLFGSTLSLHAGTGTPVVAMVGVPDKDLGQAFSAGKIYSFGKFGPTQWGLLTTIQAADPQNAAQFGLAIASSSSVLLAGAPGYNSYDGAVYVFRRPGIDWEQIQRLDAPFPQGHFGEAISMDGNMAVIGAPGVDDDAGGQSTIDAGHAYVYSRNTTTGLWTRTGTFVEPILAYRSDFDHFGAAVAYQGGWAAVGIPGRDAAVPGSQPIANAGAVRIFANTASGWQPAFYFTNPSPALHAQFGTQVDMSGEWLAVAAPGNANGAPQSGAVYMYKRTGLNWALVETLGASPATTNGYFGSSLDLNGDTLVVGTANEARAYVFRRMGDHWMQDRRIDKPAGALGMGQAVGVLGNDMVVTNTQQTVSGFTVAGEAYAYVLGAPQADLCSDAMPVGYGTFGACTDSAGVDAPGAAPCVVAGVMTAPDVWWSFTAPASGLVEISTEGSNFDTVLSVHAGCPASANNAIACDDDISTSNRQSKIVLPVAQGQTYIIRGSGYNGAAGSMTLKITATSSCYANCDGSTVAPTLNALDFSCFLNRYRAGDAYANCDGSTVAPVLNALDFSCFLNTYRAGCP